MKVQDLNNMEKEELKERLFLLPSDDKTLSQEQKEILQNCSWINDIPDSLIEEYFAGINFVKDDFWCNQNKGGILKC